MREFGYSRGNFVTGIIGTFVGAAYVVWRLEERSIWLLPFILVLAFVHAIYPLAKVKIDSEKISISYPYPFRKGLEIEHHEVDSYNPVKMKGKKEHVIMGFITPKGGKARMLWASGTRDFPELSALLEDSYPRKDYNAEPAASDNGDKSPRLS